MKKICPYCGRKGELGVSCKGCGYVLTVNDQDVPGDQWKSYVENFWEMPVSPKKFRDRRAANISFQFLNLNITTNTFGGDAESDEDQEWKQAENPRDGQEGFGQMQEDRVRGKAERSRDPKQHSQPDRADAFETSHIPQQTAKSRRDSAVHSGSGSGSFLISLFGLVLILYGAYGFTRMFHFFPDGRPLDGIVGVSLMAAVALTGSMCIRPLRLRFWKAVRWPIALGYAAAIGIPLALMIFDLAAIM